MAVGIQLIWENNGNKVDSALISADEKAIQAKVETSLIGFLTNKPNTELQKDWSSFGKSGDCIKVVPVNGKQKYSEASHSITPIEF